MNTVITSLTTSFTTKQLGKPESDIIAVQKTGRSLVSATVRHFQDNNFSKSKTDTVLPLSKRDSRTWKVLLTTIEELSARHETAVRRQIKQLFDDSKTESNSPGQAFNKTVKEMFAGDVYNWGRIATYYAFVAWSVKFCAEENYRSKINDIEKAASDYVANNLSVWITEQGGWSEFEKFFDNTIDFESQLWNGLSYMLFGLGTLAAFVATR